MNASDARLRELFAQFVRTELVSPDLLECLEQRLAEVLGTDIDIEIVRNSLLGTGSGGSHHHHSHQIHANNTDHLEGNSLSFWTDDNEFPLAGSSTGRPATSPMVQRKLQAIADEMAKGSTRFWTFHLEATELCRHLVHDLWRLEKQEQLKKRQFEEKSKTAEKNQKDKKLQRNGKKDLKRINGFQHDLHHSPSSSSTLFSSRSLIIAENNNFGHEYDDGDEHNVALSSFSLLDQSMQEWPEEEMQNVVGLICSDGIEQHIRLTNIHKLNFLSPLTFSKSKAFEIFLGHLHAILPIPLLFNDTMHVLARILNCHNELIWVKSAICLSRVALGLMRARTLGRPEKMAFVEFLCQIMSRGPTIWQYFTEYGVGQIVQSFMEMLTGEISAGGGGGPMPEGLLAMMARVEPAIDWIRPWIHRQTVRKLMVQKFAELVHEVLEHYNQFEYRPGDAGGDSANSLRHSPFYWAFQCSLLQHCLRHLPLYNFIRQIFPDPVQLHRDFCLALLKFLTLVLCPPSITPTLSGQKPRGFGVAKRVIVDGLLETTKTDCGAALLGCDQFLVPLFSLSSSSDQVPSSSSSDVPLKVLLNVLVHSPSLPSGTLLLPKVEKHIRNYMMINHLPYNQQLLSSELIIQLLSILFERYPVDQLLPTFADLIHTFLIPQIPKLDPSKPDHRRLIITTAHLTVRDCHNALQWREWRKTVGRAVNRLIFGPQPIDGISLDQPRYARMIFPLAIDLNAEEKQLATSELLQFLGIQKRDTGRSRGHGVHNTHSQQNMAKNRLTVISHPDFHRLHTNHHHHHPPGITHSLSSSSLHSGQYDTGCPCSSSAEDSDEKFFVQSTKQRLNCLDFLPNAPTDFAKVPGEEPIPVPIFLLITQPGLLIDLFQSVRLGDQLVEKFVAFERNHHDEKRNELAHFVGRMDFLVANLDVLVELRHLLPNLGSRVAKLLHKYCSDHSGHLFLDELATRFCAFLSHSIISASAEHRFARFDKLEKMYMAVENIPESLYRLERNTENQNGKRKMRRIDIDDEEEMGEEVEYCARGEEEEDEERLKWSEAWDEMIGGKIITIEETTMVAGGNDHETSNGEIERNPETRNDENNGSKMMLNGMKSAEKEAGGDDKKLNGGIIAMGLRQQKIGKSTGTAQFVSSDHGPSMSPAVPLTMEEADAKFWFSALPKEDTPASRRELLRTLFSPGWRAKWQLRPFAVLKAFSDKFWPMPEQRRLNARPVPHSEWLGLLADYAKALNVAPGSRAHLRHEMSQIRLLASAPNDWFISAVFLASGLSVEDTVNFCERFLAQCKYHWASCIWPVCFLTVHHSSPCLHSFSDLLALRVFPRVLSLLRSPSSGSSPVSPFRTLAPLLCSASCPLPSLLHLFLFFTHQCYLGILPFRAVQQYLLAAVFGGPDLQALHFCAVLEHIFRRSVGHHSLYFSSKLAPLFLRPALLANFDFSNYAHLIDKAVNSAIPGEDGP